jgi:hypothetical protein
MATDLASLRSLVRTQTLVETDDVADSVLNTHLNAGLNKLSLLFEWPFLEADTTLTVAADTQTVALPSDYRMLFDISDEDKRYTLTRLTRNQALRRWGGDPPSSDNALWYYVHGTNIYFVPIPSTADTDRYRIFYQKAITELSVDGDTPEFISEYHTIASHYAIARVWEHLEDFPKAEAADATFLREADNMARYYHAREKSEPLIFGDGVSPNTMGIRANMPWLDDAS